MSTVLICREMPYPPTSGSPLRMWQQINLLAKQGPVHVFTVSHGPAGIDEMPLATTWEHVQASDVRVRRWPSRLRIVRDILLTQYPTDFGDFADATIDKRLRRFIQAASPSHVILSHWNAAMPAALRDRRRTFSVIVDAHNVEWRLESDRRAERGLKTQIRDWSFRRHEIDLFKRTDRTWVTSEEDRSSAVSLVPAAAEKVVVWPNAIDVNRIDSWFMQNATNSLPLGKQSPTVIFVGYMAYKPNELAAITAIRRIFPVIKARFSSARLLIVGKDPGPAIFEAAEGDPDIIVTGTVPDVLGYLAVADVSIVPLSVGGGTRLKILEAFASRVPVVSTSKGAEGIATARAREILIEDDLDAMGTRIVDLLENESARRSQIEAGRALVDRDFSWSALSARLESALGN